MNQFIDRDELPDGLRSALPEEAQQLYLDAFNQAWGEYNAHIDDGTRQQSAHRYAWSAVRRHFTSLGVNWRRRS